LPSALSAIEFDLQPGNTGAAHNPEPKMQTTIESQDRRFRAVLTDTDAGVRVQLLRDAGAHGRGPNARIMWRQLQVATIDKPFSRVCEKAYDWIWPMVDDRP
jgi:hypothetical protein